MTRLPTLLVSSVVRGTRQGDSHGGLYLVDLDRDTFEQVLDWNAGNIDFEGRGGDRGLRGIAVLGEEIYVAASDELFVFNRRFEIVRSFRNAYLKHCHEIWHHRGRLFLTSTGFDSILSFDIATRKFEWGLHLRRAGTNFAARSFNPEATGGPAASIELHLNNVFVNDQAIYFSGRELSALMAFSRGNLTTVAVLPWGTHNARPFRDGLIVNDTEADCVRWVKVSAIVSLSVPRYPEEDLLHTDLDTSGIARQGFGRGLCPLSDTLVAAGSSPTTVSVYDLAREQRVKSINLTMDIRNAAHGMAVWPL